MRLCPSNNNSIFIHYQFLCDVVIAIGGRENDVALYDIETQEAVFKGRNVPEDFLHLRVPIWVADMRVSLKFAIF